MDLEVSRVAPEKFVSENVRDVDENASNFRLSFLGYRLGVLGKKGFWRARPLDGLEKAVGLLPIERCCLFAVDDEAQVALRNAGYGGDGVLRKSSVNPK